jgi:hypothetical protein
MEISNTQQDLSDYLNNPEVLTNPEPFLGPNWETVLRWWLYCESLTDEQKHILRCRCWAIDNYTRIRAWNLASDAAFEVIGRVNWWAAWDVVPPYLPIIRDVAPYLPMTYELISMHLLFERGYSLTFVPLIKDL